jgi:hypothetical protein
MVFQFRDTRPAMEIVQTSFTRFGLFLCLGFEGFEVENCQWQFEFYKFD